MPFNWGHSQWILPLIFWFLGVSSSYIRDSPYFSAGNYGRCYACGQLNPAAPVSVVHPHTPGSAPYAASVGANVSAFVFIYFLLVRMFPVVECYYVISQFILLCFVIIFQWDFDLLGQLFWCEGFESLSPRWQTFTRKWLWIIVIFLYVIWDVYDLHGTLRAWSRNTEVFVVDGRRAWLNQS